MVLLGNSSLHSCKLNNTVVTMCSVDTPNIRSSLTLRKSKMTDSRIVNQGPCKNLKLVIIGCSIDTYLDRNSQDYQGTVTFDVGPATNLNVEIIDTWVDGTLLLTSQQKNNNISLHVYHCEFNLKHSDCGVKVRLSYEATNNNIQINVKDSKVLDAVYHGLAVEVQRNQFSVQDNHEKSPLVISITIRNCTFINNEVAVLILEDDSIILLRLEMLITDSTFYGNGNAIDFRRSFFQKMASVTMRTITSHLYVSLRNVTLEKHCPHLSFSEPGVILIVDVDILNIQDCRFINNQGTAVKSYYSAVTLAGDTLFSNNTSTRGGALFLYESYLYINVLSIISFFNNSAKDTGGAIYVKERPYFAVDLADLYNRLVFTPCARSAHKG